MYTTILSNRDQRIAADINILCLVYSGVAIKVVVSPFTIAYYSYKAYVGYDHFHNVKFHTV